MSLCPSCNAPVQDGSSACGTCGASLGGGEPTSRTCPSCGSEIAPGNRFCTQCGSEIHEQVGPEEPTGRSTSRLTAPPNWDTVEVTHLRPDQHEKHVVKERFIIGRDRGDLTIPSDPFLSTTHAMIRREAGTYLLQDLGSRNGTFIRIREAEALIPGDELLMGSQILRYRIESGDDGEGGDAGGGGFVTQALAAPSQGGPVLVRVVERRRVDEVYPLSKDRMLIGREDCDISFPDDGLLSGTHASVTVLPTEDGARHFIKDEESRNGVFLRVRDLWRLQQGDIFTAGRQVFRFEGEAAGE